LTIFLRKNKLAAVNHLHMKILEIHQAVIIICGFILLGVVSITCKIDSLDEKKEEWTRTVSWFLHITAYVLILIRFLLLVF